MGLHIAEYVQDFPGDDIRMTQKATGVPFAVVNREVVVESAHRRLPGKNIATERVE